jgi:hypothetical protein
MCGDIGTTSKVCALYSFTGILFTVSCYVNELRSEWTGPAVHVAERFAIIRFTILVANGGLIFFREYRVIFMLKSRGSLWCTHRVPQRCTKYNYAHLHRLVFLLNHNCPFASMVQGLGILWNNAIALFCWLNKLCWFLVLARQLFTFTADEYFQETISHPQLFFRSFIQLRHS